MKITDLKENEVIHCATEEEAIRICKMMHEAGLKWVSGETYKLTSRWHTYEAETCYCPEEGVFADRKFYKDEGYTIHSSHLFQQETAPAPELAAPDMVNHPTEYAPTLASRHNSGKPKWSLVDFAALEDLVRVLEFGASKYGPNNWRKGSPYTQLIECQLRHTFAILRGEDIDPESGQSHVGHILANAMFLAHMMKFRPDMDDRKNCCGEWNEFGVCNCKHP